MPASKHGYGFINKLRSYMVSHNLSGTKKNEHSCCSFAMYITYMMEENVIFNFSTFSPSSKLCQRFGFSYALILFRVYFVWLVFGPTLACHIIR